MRLPRLTLFRLVAVVIGVTIFTGGVVIMSACTATGKSAAGARLDLIKATPTWKDGKFHNKIKNQPIHFWETMGKWLRGAENTSPEQQLPIVNCTAADFKEPPESGLRITWLGHSTALIEIDGYRILTDPVWSERASPFTWAGPKRFHPPPLPLDQLPRLDAVLISHDHYDHLDHRTIQALAERVPLFVVPLGVGAHLEYWGIPRERIKELNWWEETKVRELTLVATPARHFSGRSLVMANQDSTLWAGWAIIGTKHRVYFSGDTAMFPGFAEIGRRLGPFDAALIESGAYNVLWADVHLGPEQAVIAHQLVQGGLLIPIHWGTFDLALHAWVEPAERLLAAAKKAGVPLATPRPGQRVEPFAPPAPHRWWSEVPWQRASEAPVISTGLDDQLEGKIRALGL